MKIKKTLTLETMNQKLVGIDYAVRGPVVQRAYEIEEELKKGAKKPFERVIRANIGDCHALGQKPITFVRQVVAVAACPQLMRSPDIPDDVKQRAQEVLDECVQGSVGAYSPAPGLVCVRSRVARHLEQRDGVSAALGDVLLGAGVTDLVRALLAMFAQDLHGKPTGVMVPTPQYPLFSGSLTELGLRRVDYALDESHDWALTVSELERSWRAARHDCCVRVLVVINPGNPTGKVLERENMEEIIKFAYERNLFLLSDEVYLESVVTKPFIAFRKVVHEMGAPYSSIEMASFLSASKGWTCEAGLRCGAMELRGVSPRVMQAYNVANTLRQCPSVLGQCVMLCAVYPPEPEDPSYETFSKELEVIRRPLKHRALQAEIAFNKIPGYFCSTIEGGLFAFPRFGLPQRALEAAKKARMPPDDFYCLQMLEETGVCVVPGSGFGQQPGTYHYRITVLHSRQELDFMITSIDRFHRKFLQTYS